MDARSGLLTVLYLALIVLCGTGVWALIRIVAAAASMQRLADDLDGRLVPLIEKVSLTVNEFNAELERVDGIVTQLEDVSDRVSSTTRVAQGVVNAPAAAVANLGDRVRRFVSVLLGRRV